MSTDNRQVEDDFDLEGLTDAPLDFDGLGANGTGDDGGSFAGSDIPAEFFMLFDLDPDQLQILSEVPRAMVPTMVHMKILMASQDPQADLMAVWVNTYMKLMISLERKGRMELLDLLKSKIQGNPYADSAEVGIDEDDLWA